MEKPSNILTLKSGKTTKQVRPADIDHIVCDCSVCELHFTDMTAFACTKPLCHFEETLPETDFFRINHNAIVNLHHVSEIITTKGRRHDVRMKSGAVLAVSYRKWANFRKHLFGK